MQNDWLHQYDEQINSQAGEDGKIEKILSMFPERDHWCVEFGAWDGKHFSNVYRLVKEKNYKAVLIEGSKEKFDQISENYSKEDEIYPIHRLVDFQGENSIDSILSETNIPINFDFISIDIDSNDYYIWESIQKYRPKLVCIEFNPSIPDGVEFIQEKTWSKNHGSSLEALYKLGKNKNYELVTTTLNNGFFVDKKYFDLFNIKDNKPHTLRNDYSDVSYLFNGYDGTVFVEGYKRMMLHNIPYKASRMQMIPSSLRNWSDSQTVFIGGLKQGIYKLYKSMIKRDMDLYFRYIMYAWGIYALLKYVFHIL